MYEDLKLYIDGEFTTGNSGVGEDVLNPSTDAVLAHVPHAKQAELDAAVKAAEKGFAVWRKTSAFERSNALRKAAGADAHQGRRHCQGHDARTGQGQR